MTRAKTAMFNASDILPLSSRMSAAARVIVRPTIGVPVRDDTRPIQRGASLSSASMIATRDGTSIVALSEVVMAMMAPMVTSTAALNGRYRDAASAIGAADTRSRDAGSTPKATTDINR